MSHARAAIAGVLAAGLIVIVATRGPGEDLSESEARLLTIMLGLLLVLVLPEIVGLFLHRKDDR